MYTTCIKQQHHLYNPFIYQLEIKRGIHRWYPPYRQIIKVDFIQKIITQQYDSLSISEQTFYRSV